MNRPSDRTPLPFVPGAGVWIAVLSSLVGLSACGGEAAKSQKAEAPAKVQGAVKETELATITLSAEAEKRLGIELGAVENKRVQRSRAYGGELVVPAGRDITVSAPMAGRLAAPEGASIPVAVPLVGSRAPSGTAIFRLYPLPSAQEVLDARQALDQAKARFDAAAQKFKRSEQLLKDRAGSVRAVEEAQAELATTEAALKVAQGRVDFMAKGSDAATASLTPVLISAPLAGVILDVFSRAGENVAAGAPLFRVADTSSLWVRVPVYVGEAPSVDVRGRAQVMASDAGGKGGQSVDPISASPSANANAASVDFYYSLPNADLQFRPGQRVEVSLPLKDAEERLTVPWSSVLHDIYGGTWVYAKTGDGTYSRRRVEVRFVSGTLAVLARGPALGTKVVTAGAAELFGTEFSTGK